MIGVKGNVFKNNTPAIDRDVWKKGYCRLEEK